MALPRPNLVCKACGYANESERVYCHNCGVKLDRGILIPQQQQQEASAEKKHREVKKIMAPERVDFARIWGKLWKTVALAALAGGVIAAALPPEGGLPSAKNEEAIEAPQIDALLESLVAAPGSRRVALREAEVNAYLRREHFKSLPSWLTNSVPLRAVVHFEDGIARLTLQADVAKYPIYATLSGGLKVDKDEGLVATCTGGSIGRLQIPAPLARYAGWAIPTLLDSLKHERQLLGQLGSIEIRKEQILLGSRGPSAPAGRPAVH